MPAAKEVRVSADSGVTFYTLPGSSGEWNEEAAQITDTIFGQTFQSSEVGLITWTATANALYKGFAGYVAKIKRSGIATTLTDEATTLVSGLTYQITADAKQVLDLETAVVVKDNAIAVSAANILSLDYLFGKVTFIPGYSVAGAITISGKYLPMAEVGKASSFTLTQTAETKNTTDFQTAQANGGYSTFLPGLRNANLELGGFYDVSEAFWEVLQARKLMVIEINPDGSGLSLARGFYKLVTRGQSGDVGALEEETRTFALQVPEGPAVVFSWQHDPATTLSQALRIMMDAWLNETLITVEYAPDGADFMSFTGNAVITDMSLSSGLEAMNEFAASFQGSSTPAYQSA